MEDQWEKELRGSPRPDKLVRNLLSVVTKIEAAYDKEIKAYAGAEFVSVRKLGADEVRRFESALSKATAAAEGIIADTAQPLCGEVFDYVQAQARAYRPKAKKLTLPRTVRDNYVRACKSYISGESKDIRADAKRTVANWLANKGEITSLRQALSSLLNRSKGHSATVFRSEIQNAYVELVKEANDALGFSKVRRIVSSTACKLCKALEGLHSSTSKKAYEIPHPNCACTFEPVAAEEDIKMAKQKLSHSDIRSLLQQALNGFRTDPNEYIWIRDVFDDRVVYAKEPETGLWARTYEIDKENNVTLGDPAQVIVKTSYETVALMSTFSVGPAATETADDVIRKGKIFEVGDYPDKDFAISIEELEEAIAAFQPVNVDYEHVSGPLDGKLGKLQKVWLEGQELFGEVSLPKWLDEALGEAERRVSTTWDKATKTLKGLALVVNPRVSDAALMAAFAGARHSAQDSADIQASHDLLVKLGAVCAPKETTMAKNEKDVQEKQKDASVGFKEAFLQFLGLSEANLSQPATPPAPQPVVAEIPVEFKNQMDSLQAELAKARADRITAEATAFADSEIHAGRAFPAQREALIAEFTEAATDDVVNPREVTFSAVKEGVATQVKGTRVDALKARHLSIPAHNLTKDGLGDADRVQALFNQQSQPKEGEEGIKPEDYQAMMSATPLGRAILEKQSKEKTKSA